MCVIEKRNQISVMKWMLLFIAEHFPSMQRTQSQVCTGIPRSSIHPARAIHGWSSGRLPQVLRRLPAPGEPHLLSLQTLPCTPELTKPWLIFLHHPLAVVNTKPKQSDENWWAHKPRGPHERPPGQLALGTLYNFSKQGSLKPRGDECSTTQTEGVSLNRMHTGMDLSLKRQSKTSLPSPPENGTTTPINDDGLVFYYFNKKPWSGYYRRKGLFGLIVLIRVHYRRGKEAGRHGGWGRSC